MQQVSFKNIAKGISVGLLLIAGGSALTHLPAFDPIKSILMGKKTVANRLSEYEEAVENRLSPFFQRQNISYPPERISLIFIKAKKELLLFSKDSDGNQKLIKTYKVLSASGKYGPKLREGDYQVPEGIYSIEALNPNSEFHLSLRINYPNNFDRKYAAEDGRSNLGTDIMIHGTGGSIGCISIADTDVEELFVLAAKSNYRTWKVIISPVDFNSGEVVDLPSSSIKWLPKLYGEISEEMKAYKN